MGNNSVIVGGISIASIILFVKATLTLAQSMQWFTLGEEQWAVLSNYVETVIPILAVAVATWWTSRNTTDLSSPRDVDGATLSRPDSTPAIKEMEVIQTDAIKVDAAVNATRGIT